MMETVVLGFFFFFFGTRDTFLGFIDKQKVKKEQHLFKLEMFSNYINLYYHFFFFLSI